MIILRSLITITRPRLVDFNLHHPQWSGIACFSRQIRRSSSPALNGYARIENTVLGALAFRMMRDREAEIDDTYEQAFNWIFEDPKVCGKPWANLQKWLHEDSGCYWVEGKAGSRKSTLMKFISANP